MSFEPTYDATAYEHDVHRNYLTPFHVNTFDQQSIEKIGCDDTLVGLSENRKVVLWGGAGVQSANTVQGQLLSSTITLSYLQNHGIKDIRSSGSELVAIDTQGIAFVSTDKAAQLLYSPTKFLALKV